MLYFSLTIVILLVTGDWLRERADERIRVCLEKVIRTTGTSKMPSIERNASDYRSPDNLGRRNMSIQTKYLS